MRYLLRTPIPALSLALMLSLLAVGCVLTQREQVPQAEASEPSSRHAGPGRNHRPRSSRDPIMSSWW